MEDATTFVVSDTLILLYDINGNVSDTLILKYDMTGVVSDTLALCYDINGAASTQLVQQKKAVTPMALDAEIKICEKTDGPYHYAFWLSLKNMASGDKVIVRVYRWEPNDEAYELYERKTIDYVDLKGRETQDQPGVFLPFIPTERYKITIEQTDGTLREFPWELYKTS